MNMTGEIPSSHTPVTERLDEIASMGRINHLQLSELSKRRQIIEELYLATRELQDTEGDFIREFPEGATYEFEGAVLARVEGRSYLVASEDDGWQSNDSVAVNEDREPFGYDHIVEWVVDLDSSEFTTYRLEDRIPENLITGIIYAISCTKEKDTDVSSEHYREYAERRIEAITQQTMPVGTIYDLPQSVVFMISRSHPETDEYLIDEA